MSAIILFTALGLGRAQTGTADAGFPVNIHSNVLCAAVQPDGKIVIGGSFTNIAGTTRNRIARLNSDGSLDLTFNPNASADVNAIAIQGDGKVLLGGAFTNVGGSTRLRIARVNADGSPDLTFNPAASNVVNNIALQPDGKIVVGGSFTNIAAALRNRLARLNADGSLDTNFNPSFSNTVYAVALQLDGKIIVGGDFTNVTATTRYFCARLNADGSLDSAFTPNPSNSVFNATVQADGKIIIGGSFTNVAGTARNRIARLNASGSLDTSFNPNASNVVNSVVVQADGKIILGGSFTNVGGATVRNRIARLNSDGTLDSTFDPNSSGLVNGIALQGDGAVLVGGVFTNIGGTTRTNLARLLNDSVTQSLTVPSADRIEWLRGGASPEAQVVTFDFSTDGGLTWAPIGAGTRIAGGWEITGLTLPASGLARARARIGGGIYNGSSGLVETNGAFGGFTSSAPLVATGTASNIIDVAATLTAAINPAGSPTVAQFEYGNTTNYGSVAAITLSPSNGVATQYVATAISGLTPGTNYHFRIVASNSAGMTFGADQTFSTPLLPDIAVEQPLGTNLVDNTTTVSFGASLVGFTNSPKTFTIRNVGLTNMTGIVITKDGAHSNDFTMNTNGLSASLAPGESTTFTIAFAASATGFRTGALHIASSDPDENPFDIPLLGSGYQPGNVDTNVILGASSTVHAMAVQPDGKTIIAGFFTTVGGVARSRIARLNADGTLDTNFNPNASSDIYSVAVLDDGKILAGGGFATIGGGTRPRLARLNSDGTIDNSFNANITGVIVYDIVVQPDGKILVAGDFTTFGATTRNRVARLNPDGSLDTTFNPNASGTVYSMALQDNGKILLGGAFTSVGGASRTNVARLNADGTADATFAPTVNSTVYNVAVQADGKISLGGVFGTVNSNTRSSFARLNSDGTLDAFNPAPNSPVYHVSQQANGKIIIAGQFGTIASNTRNGVARFNADNSIDTVFNPNVTSSTLVYGSAVQSDGQVFVGGSFTLVGGLPRTNVARLFNDFATQSLAATAQNRIEWLRGGAAPEAQSVTFDFSTDGGSNWIALGAATRLTNGWELTGVTLPASGLVRGRARVRSGAYNGSSGLVETSAPFSGFTSQAPMVLTGTSSNLSDVFASVGGRVNPAGSPTTAWFEYGTTVSYGLLTNVALAPANGATTQNISAVISGLTPGTTYHYRLAASNSVGVTLGDDQTFTTLMYPDIAVMELGGTNFIDGASTNNFGASLVGITNAPRTFVISNVGLVDLTGLVITKDGAQSNDFVLDANSLNTTVAPGASTTFTVTFVPGSTGTRTAAIHIANNDPDENPFDFTVLGAGYRPGDLDTNYNPNAGSTVFTTTMQPDGKLVVGGAFTSISTPARAYLAKLNTDGTVDPPFTNANFTVYSTIALPDGKTLLAGDFTSVAGITRNRIARLNANGTLDLSFSNSVLTVINCMAVLPDGKILIGGGFTAVGSVTRNHFARLNADGTLDLTYTNYFNNTTIYSVLPLPDGKVMVAGNFTQVNGATRDTIARLNANGSLDTTFTNVVNNTVYTMALQPDGKILIGGLFSSVSGQTRNRLSRLNADGTVDSLDLGANGPVYTVALQTDGKILVGGSFFNVNGSVVRNYIARLNGNGTLDAFDANASTDVDTIAIQPDGRVVIGGAFATVGGVARNRIARLLNDFATQSLTIASNRIEWLRGGASAEAVSVTVDFSTDAGTNWTSLGAATRITGGWEMTNLSLPPAGLLRARARTVGGYYNASAGFIETNAAFSGFAASPPVVTTLDASNTNVLTATLNARVNPSGSPSTAYFEYGTTTSYGSVIPISLSPANGASAQTVSANASGLTGGTTYHYRVVASNSLGVATGDDVAFTTLVQPEIAVEQPTGTNLVDGVSSVAFGNALVGNPTAPRTFTIRNLGVADLTITNITKDGAHAADFTLDTNGMSATVPPGGSTTFNVVFNPTATNARTAAIHIVNNDTDENPFDITLTGTATKAGDLDPSFNPNASDYVRSVVQQPDGKLMALGLFTTIGGAPRTNIARLNLDGTADTSFNLPVNSTVDAITIQPDRKLLLGGSFTSIGGQPRNRIARADTNGVVDSYNPNAEAYVQAMVPQPDGKTIVCGNFTNILGQIRRYIARLNADGTLDTNFNPNANARVISALPQLDGKVLVWGDFTSIGGAGRNRFARLNSDGSPDLSFNPAPDGGVGAAALQSDGKIIVGGGFLNIGGIARTRIARLNTDGSADTNFVATASDYVGSIAIQADGKILIAGDFTTVSSASRLYIARLTTNGAADTVFTPFNQGFGVSGVTLQSDGRVVINGSFTISGNTTRNRISRFINDATSESLTVPNANRVEWLRGGTLPEAYCVTFDVSVDNGASWIPLGAGTRVAGGWELTGITLPPSGQVRGQARVAAGVANTATYFQESITPFAGLPAPEFVLMQPVGTELADGESRSFGSVLLGTSNSMTFVISNAGTANLNGIAITKDGANAADFALDTNAVSATLAPGATASFTVTFAPGALGVRAAVIHIANNDLDESAFDVVLSGSGVAPEISVEHPAGVRLTNGSATINFGSVTPGASSAAKIFTITNEGTSPLLGISVALDGVNSSDFSLNTNGTSSSVAPGASTAFSVVFSPALAGASSAAVHVASSDADESPFDIALTGTGANQSPVLVNPIPDRNATATQPFTYTFPPNTFADPDAAQSLTYTAFRDTGGALPAWLTFTAAMRTFSGTPAPADVGTLGVRVIATDNGSPSLSVTDVFDIVIAPIAPSVLTAAATSVGSYGATLQAVINPNGLATAAQFEYGATTNYGSIATITLTPNNGTTAQNVSATLSSLAPNTTYHFRAVATNSAGGNAGLDFSFVTDPPPPGLADSDFNPSSVFGVLTIALQPDGKILAGGDYAQINGRPYLPRLNADGTSDLSWNPFNFSRSYALMALPDGKVLDGGSQANAQTGINLVRLQPTGALDNSLNELAFNNFVFAMAMQPDGKLVVGGAFTTAFGQPRVSLARINADGATLDTTFTNLNLNGQVLCMAGLPDGKVIVGGGFTQIAGQPRNFIARLNADGTLDTNFVASAAAGVVALALQGNGQILYISSVPATGAYRLTRLNADGTVDSSFTPTNNNTLFTLAVQTDGKILIGGDFTQVNSQPRNRLARLTQTGSLDLLFNPNPNSEVTAVMLQADGKILVGGQFTNISNEAHQRLARLNNDPATQSLTVPTPNRVQWLRGGASPEAVAVTFEFTADGGLTWTPLGYGTRISGGWEKTGFTLPPSGLVRARAVVAGGYRGNCFSLLESTAPFSGFPPSQPYVTTLPATAVDETFVTLHASVNPAGSGTTAQFEYGTNTSYGSVAPITLSPNNGSVPQQINLVVNGLRPATLYHFRVTATNGIGGAAGSNYTFTTLGFPEIAVQEPAGTDIADGGSVSFGTVLAGTPQVKTFVITNAGTTNLAGLSISKNGSNAAEFTVGALSTNLIPPGGSVTFTVTFNTVNAGAKSAAIHIASNDADESSFDINLSATAISPEIVVESPPGTPLTSNLQAGFDEIFCGQAPLGSTNTRTVVVRNTGSADLHLTSLVLGGTGSNQFTLGPLSATNLPPGSNATFVVYFHPTGGMEALAHFKLFNDDLNENPFQIQLRGAIEAPDIVVEQPQFNGLTDNVSVVNYGNVRVGLGMGFVFYIKNNGNYNLTGLAVTKDGPNADQFQIGSLSAFSVYPGVTETFQVVFVPSGYGARTAAVHIASSDPDENPFDVTVTGVAVSPDIAVQRPVGSNIPRNGTNDLGAVDVGSSGDFVFTVTNAGNDDLGALALGITGPNASEFTITTNLPGWITPSNSATFALRFSPVAEGNKRATLHVTNSMWGQGVFSFTLTANGAAPHIVVEQPAGTDTASGGTNAFGVVFLGTNADHVFTIRNIGLRDLSGLNVMIDGTNASEFAVISAPVSPVNSSNTTTFALRFTPVGVGLRTAVLHIASNDGERNPFNVVVTGIGYTPNLALNSTYDVNLTPRLASNAVDVVAYGRAQNDFFGQVARVADLNGDDVGDLIVSAERAGNSAGAVFVWFGKTNFAGVKDAAGVYGTPPDFSVFGANSDDYMTSTENITTADVNGDGIADLIIGASNASGPGESRPQCGEAYVIFGRRSPATFPSQIHLSTNGADVTIYGASAGDYLTGYTDYAFSGGKMTAGDLNGDGIADIVLGALTADGPGNSRADSGEAYIIFGRTNFPSILDLAQQGTNGASVTIYGASAGDLLTGRQDNFQIADFNGDGQLDLALGCERGSGVGEARTLCGEAYIVFGRANFPATLDLAVQGSTGANVTIYGSRAYNQTALLAHGDVNGDGVSDLLLGSYLSEDVPANRNESGTAYVVFGRTNFPPTLDLLAQGTSGASVTIYGKEYGYELGSAGMIADVNGDGIDDLIIGAIGGDGPNGQRGNAGELCVIFGRGSATPFPLTLDTAVRGSNGVNVTIYGRTAGDLLGGFYGHVFASDLNSDGFDDICAQGFVVLGRSTAAFPETLDMALQGSAGASITINASARTGGDVNGDGIPDLVVNGFGNEPAPGRVNEGEAYVIFGIASPRAFGSVTNGTLVVSNSPGANGMSFTMERVTVGGTNFIELHDANNPLTAADGAIQVDANTIRVPASSVTGQLQINGSSGDDHFVIDARGGCVLPPGGAVVNGGAQGVNGDTLQVLGGFATVQYDATSPGAGVVHTACGDVSFTGLEPVDFTGATIAGLAVNVDPLNALAGAVTTTVTGSSGNTRVAFSGGLELIDVGVVTSALTILGDSADVDTIVLSGVGTNFAGNFTVLAQGSDSVVMTNTSLALAAGRVLDVTAGSVSIGTASVTGSVTFHGGAISFPLNGPSDSGRLSVVGGITLLGSPSLVLSGSYTPQPGDVFTLIDNDGTDAVAGNFAGLPEGTQIVLGGTTLRLSYVGGTGNDVVLSAASPPQLPVQSDRSLAELAQLVVTNTATDADGPAGLTYLLTNAPAGAAISANGVITWTPTETQGPGTNTLTTIVTDPTGLRATNSFTVIVTEVNAAPVFATVTNYVVNPGESINTLVTATDSDWPPNVLTYSLINPPTGANVDAASGTFSWRTRVDQRDTTNVIRIRVQDDGSPGLSATNSFTVTVNPLAPVTLASLAVSNKFVFRVSGTRGPDYVILASDDLSTWSDVATNLAPVTPFEFEVPANAAKRFYKARLAP